MANTAEQMKVFGYTPEGLDQEVEKYAGEAKEDFAESKLEEERRANHPLNNVPFFQRPVNASTDDIEVPTSDSDVRAFKNKFGETYTIAISPDQRNEYKKLRDGIINSIEGIKGYLEDPSLPSKEQVVDFVKGAAVGTLEQIKKSMSSGATYGDIFGTIAGVGAASTPFKVPSEPGSTTLRIFGGRGSKSGQKDYSKEFEALRLKKEGASPEEIEAATGRVETAPASSYINSLQPTLTEPRFKFEIDDSQVKINGSYKTAYGTRSVRDASLSKPAFLEQVINHPVLFDEYPDLKDLRFVFDNIMEKNGNLGHYDPKQNAIVLDNKYKNMSFNSPEFREIFFHELQHATQALDYRHGFLEILGANPDEIKRLLANTGQQLQDSDPYNYANLLKNKKIIKYRNDIINFYNKNKEALDNKSNPKLVNKFAKMFYFLDQEVYKEYLKGGAEIEARVTGVRAKNLGQKPIESASSAIAKESDFTSFKKRLKDLTQIAGTKFNFMLGTGGEKFTNTYYKDAMNFARYATGQDKDFNTGSDPNVSPMAGFTGDNPPTYKRRIFSKPDTDPTGLGVTIFRKPIIEFVRSLDVPKKGILGSNFLKLVEKNPSISPTSLQEQLITPTKRYSKEELKDIFIHGEFLTSATTRTKEGQTLGGLPIGRFEKFQRQKSIGFRGGEEKGYFETPISAFEEAYTRGFRPKQGTHFGDSAIAHVRGSIIKRNPENTMVAKGQNSGFKGAPEFSKIVGDNPFLLAEEIQSNLVKGGFMKTNFDEIYDEAIDNFDAVNEIKYDEAFAPVGDDKKFRDLVKEIDKENPFLPDEFIYEYGLEYGLGGERQSRNFGIRPPRDSKNTIELTNFKKYLREKLKSKGFLKDFFPSEEIKTTERLFDFYGRYRQNVSARTLDVGTEKERKALKEYSSPPITKTKQVVEESLKALIGKAVNEGVNYIVFPNVTRIKMARNKKFDPNAKGDMFYKMYFKELNEALMDLEKNYPVEIYSVDLPYDDKAFLSSASSMLDSEVPRLYLDTFKEFVESNSPKLTNEVIPSNGTVLDITKLVKEFVAEEPRQFAEGGDTVRPEPKPEAEVDVSPRTEAGDQFFVKQAEREKAFKTKPKPRPSMDKSFPDVKPKARPKRVEKSGVYTEEYDLKGVSVEIPVIVFKDGERIAFDKALQTIAERGTANEPVVGMNTEKQIRKFLDENNPTREEFETYWYNKRLNKGGMIGDQMQMAFMNEGGLTDDGMDVDPVSGNDIPAGSMAEEVRDDIPAQLSDGEYVVPADVVRYYGVKFFEDLRERAKIGLAEMEANGRIGGEPVPAGGPMNTEELSPEEMQAIQEMMGMSQGGAIGQFKQQQEVLEQPPAKAVGNPVMMYKGGLSEADILGGKTSAQVEQDMLAQGNAAMNQNYTGIPLGSTIFDPVNTNTGVQQTEAKAFAPITLYNTAGQTRTVNSAAEEKSARAAGFNMTLDQYNMYRSQRGGSGGSGGGSGIITPPGQEDKESKPWGEGVDWNNQDSIRKFVKEAQEGNIEGASGRFLRGAGFALLGLPGAMLVGAFQTFQGKQTLADMQTAQEIARANGFDDLATEIQGDINTYLKTAGDAINFVNDVFGPSTSQADRWARTQGFDTLEEYAAAQEDMRAKAEIVKKKTPSFKGLKSTYTKKTDKPYVKVDKDGKTISKTSSTKPGATPSVTPKGDLDVAKEQEKYEGGPGFRNKGGLMTKNKKAKK